MMTVSCWLQITAGQGPEECALAVGLALRQMMKEAEKQKIALRLLDYQQGRHKETYESCLLGLEGQDLTAFIRSWEGSIQWICTSPYRPHHKRKNWFIGVNILMPLEDKTHDILLKDVRFDTMRASGAGGQHVNTTDSAVRVTHIPTGLVAFAQEERSQHMNKKLALSRLTALLEAEKQAKQAKKTLEQWQKHHELERGNPTRTFTGEKFQLQS